MASIDELYHAAVDEMSAKDRIARMMELFNWSREFLGRQMRQQHPEASEQRMKLLVALRMYGHEPGMRQLVEGLLARVPN